MRLFTIVALGALVLALGPAADASGYVLRSYSQTYQIAAQGAITVICPDAATATTPTAWTADCVPMYHDGEAHEGAPPEKQIWFGGVGIDMPLDAIPQSVTIMDASGTATPGAICLDHDMDNICGASDAEQEHGEEISAFFCGSLDGLDAIFPPMPPMAGMVTQHMDVWVRSAGSTGWATDQVGASAYGAPLCAGLDVEDGGALGVGTRGTVTITALVPSG